MNDRLQTQQFGPDFSVFLPHSYGYEAANELKSVYELLDFRFGPYSRTGSKQVISRILGWQANPFVPSLSPDQIADIES